MKSLLASLLAIGCLAFAGGCVEGDVGDEVAAAELETSALPLSLEREVTQCVARGPGANDFGQCVACCQRSCRERPCRNACVKQLCQDGGGDTGGQDASGGDDAIGGSDGGVVVGPGTGGVVGGDRTGEGGTDDGATDDGGGESKTIR